MQQGREQKSPTQRHVLRLSESALPFPFLVQQCSHFRIQHRCRQERAERSRSTCRGTALQQHSITLAAYLICAGHAHWCPLHRRHSGQRMLPRRRRDLRLREAPLKLAAAAAAVSSPAAAAAAAADQRLRLRRRRLLGACGPCHSTGTLYVQKRRRQHACSVIAHVDD